MVQRFRLRVALRRKPGRPLTAIELGIYFYATSVHSMHAMPLAPERSASNVNHGGNISQGSNVPSHHSRYDGGT